MQISFFEEFPDRKNLEKLKLVGFPIKLYLAAPNLEEFLKLKNKILKIDKKIKEIIYWPILSRKEGYWISPFSSRQALKRIFSELEGKKIPVMLDLELPTTRNPRLYFTQFFGFAFNKRLILRFISDYLGEVYLAEYYPEGKGNDEWLGFLGLHYSVEKVKVIKMVYHSMHGFKEEFIIKELGKGVEKYGANYLVAYGTISKGVMGTEPILSPEQLWRDLKIAKKGGVKEVVVYRLGGLDKKYLKMVQKVIKS